MAPQIDEGGQTAAEKVRVPGKGPKALCVASRGPYGVLPAAGSLGQVLLESEMPA